MIASETFPAIVNDVRWISGCDILPPAGGRSRNQKLGVHRSLFPTVSLSHLIASPRRRARDKAAVDTDATDIDLKRHLYLRIGLQESAPTGQRYGGAAVSKGNVANGLFEMSEWWTGAGSDFVQTIGHSQSSFSISHLFKPVARNGNVDRFDVNRSRV